jgi:hypothetical protein
VANTEEWIRSEGHGQALDAKVSASDADKSGGLSVQKMIRYDSLRPIVKGKKFQTDIFAVNESCLAVARMKKDHNCCLVTLGSTYATIGPPGFKGTRGHRANGPLKDLCECSNFQELAFQDCRPLPKWGGVYVPGVNVNHSRYGAPFPLATVYADSLWGPLEIDVARLRAEVQEKLLNVLRICSHHNHLDVIVASNFETPHNYQLCSARDVAGVFKEILTASDLAGVFRRVIFAFPERECSTKVLQAFDRKFQREDVPARSISLAANNSLLLTASGHDGNGGKVDLQYRSEVNDVYDEKQVWELGSDGRVVLRSSPELCLSAQNRSNPECSVHLWGKVTGSNRDNQIWLFSEDGSLVLAAKPNLTLTSDDSGRVYLRERFEDDEAFFSQQAWLPLQTDVK